MSLAVHNGLLFLSDFPEFPRNIILSQPYKTAGRSNRGQFSSSFMLVGAMRAGSFLRQMTAGQIESAGERSKI